MPYTFVTTPGSGLLIARESFTQEHVDGMVQQLATLPEGISSPHSKEFRSFFTRLDKTFPLERYGKILLALGDEHPYDGITDELARRLGVERCWRVTWKDDALLGQDVIDTHGVEVFQDCLRQAAPFPVAGIVTPDMMAKDVERYWREGDIPGLSIGLSALDLYFRIKPGELTVITGIPQHGKSFFTNFLMVQLARLHGWTFAAFSPENYPLERYQSFLIAQYAERHFHSLQQYQLWEAQAWLHEHFAFIVPDEDDDSPTLDRILALAKTQVQRMGIQGLLIDPWNELDHERHARKTETEYISECLTKVRRFARRYKVAVFIVAHPTKMKKAESGHYEGKFPPPTAYDVSGSANWYNKPDNILCVWRDLDSETDLVEIHSQKVRFRGNGHRPGKATIQFTPRTGVYRDAAAHDAKDAYV